MALTLSKIVNNTATVKVKIGDGELTIQYYPNKITEKVINTNTASVSRLLPTIIKNWDLYEDDEQQVMFPLDPDRILNELGVNVTSAIVGAIAGDIRPNTEAPQTQN